MLLGFASLGEKAFGEDVTSGGGGGSETGTGAFQFQHLRFSGTGSIIHTGTGAFNFKHLAFAGTGKQEETGSGGISFKHLQFAGTGGKVSGSTGNFKFKHLTFAGSGTRIASGSINFGLKHLTFSGAGKLIHTGSGGIRFPHLTLAGSQNTNFKVGILHLKFNHLRFSTSGTDTSHRITPVVDPQISTYWRNKLPLDFLRWLGDNFTGIKQLADVVLFGNGAPNGIVVANPGTIFIRQDGGSGSTLYVKETGTDANGWVVK